MKNPAIRLLDVYAASDAADFLYRLMLERPAEALIAHRKQPTMEQHLAFMAARPYRAWCLVEAGQRRVGAVTLTPNNEVGVWILREFQRKGFARAALQELMRSHQP